MTLESDEIIDCMARMKGENRPFALATVVRTKAATAARVGAKAVIRADGSMVGWVGGGCTLGAVRKAARAALADGRARMIRIRPEEAARGRAGSAADGTQDIRNLCPSGGTVEVFVEPVLPKPSLVVAGASATARALRALGRQAGFSVTAAAHPDDLAAVGDADALIEGFALAEAPRAGTSFIVVATQGKRDREALEAALRSDAPYVAFIGSRKKAAALKDELAGRGLDAERLAALRSPAGLDIGALTPEEIALSVLAEIVQARRQAAPTDLVEVSVGDSEEEGRASVETRVVAPAAGACCGDGEKH